MAKVKKGFFCIETKVTYKAGDEYNGTRTDLGHLLEEEKKEVKEQKTTRKTKELKTAKSTK